MKKSIILLIFLILISVLSVNSAVPPEECGPYEFYAGSDRETLGDWEGTYGNYAYILSGMNVETNNYEWPIQNGYSGPYDITGGTGINDISYSVYVRKCIDSEGRALETADEEERRASEYWGNSTITLNIPSGSYKLSIYVLDWDSTTRAENITVTDSTGSASTIVSNFHDGKYEMFRVNGGTVTVDIKKTAGPNAVISGIFIESYSSGNITYLGSDSATKGDWVGNYGSQWYLLSAMDSIYTNNNNQPENPAYDVTGGSLGVTYSVANGNYWAWTDYFDAEGGCTQGDAYAWAWTYNTTDQRALTGDDSSWSARASTWDDGGENYAIGPNLYVDLDVPPGYYYLSIYSTDFDSTCRKQIIYLIDRNTGEEIAASPDEMVGNGVYHRFYILGGEYTIIAEYTGCTNAIISGIFLDEIDCDNGGGGSGGEDIPKFSILNIILGIIVIIMATMLIRKKL